MFIPSISVLPFTALRISGSHNSVFLEANFTRSLKFPNEKQVDLAAPQNRANRTRMLTANDFSEGPESVSTEFECNLIWPSGTPLASSRVRGRALSSVISAGGNTPTRPPCVVLFDSMFLRSSVV